MGPRIPLNEIKVDGVDATQYLDPIIDTNAKQKIEMVDMKNKSEGKKQKGLLANDALSKEYDEEMAALNAQIAMNQYLMMKQMQYVDENEQGIGLKQMMMEQMERMKSMIDMSVPYDAKMFQEFNNEWKQQQQQQTDRSKHIQHRDIHSLDRGIQVHSIHHREDKDQHQPWVRHQQTSFRSKHRDIRDIHIQDHGIQVHSIHHTRGRDQHQPWAQHQHQQTSCHSKHRDIRGIHIQDHGIQVHSILRTRGRDRHQPLAQHQQTSFRSKHRDIRGIHIQVRDNQVHSIHHKAGRGQHQLLVQPQHHAFHNNDIHRQDSGIQHILDHDHSTLHTAH